MAKRGRRRSRAVGRSCSAKKPVETARQSWGGAHKQRDTATASHPYVLEDGQPTYVLLPIEEYEELIKTNMALSAIAKLNDKDSEWVDADDFALELAAERIARARKAAGLTQKQLGDKLKLPQSQISRIERNPDRTTVRTLKRIARALGVDVSALV